MFSAVLNAGFWLCDVVYVLLESIQARYFPRSIPQVMFRVRSSLTIQDLLSEYELSDIDEYESLRVLIIGSAIGVNETI